MIARIQGQCVERKSNVLTLDVHGVGYELICSQPVLDRAVLGQELTVTVYTDVKEDSITLFGFADTLEKQVFLLLKRVKGVGSRIASEVLSAVDKMELLRAIGASDTARLQAIRGVGRKLSERIIVELKEKVVEFVLEARSLTPEREVVGAEPIFRDALAALTSLGFTAADAHRMLREAEHRAPTARVDSGELVREALKYV
jgi:Holliday junction DNA helicase RuvA